MDFIIATIVAGLIAGFFYGIYFLISAPLWLFLDKFQKKHNIPEWKITTFIGYPLFLFTLWLFLGIVIYVCEYFGIG